MATLSIVLRKDKINKKGKAPIHFRITKNRKNRYISASLMLEPKYWNENKERVKPNHPSSGRLNNYLRVKFTEVEKKVLELETVGKGLTVPIIKRKVMGGEPSDFFEFAKTEQQKYWSAQQFSTHKKNKYILSKLRKYCKDRTIYFQTMDVDFIIRYENYLRDVEGNSTNTINKDFRFIRTLFNNAVKLEVIEPNHNPFLRYKLKKEKTYKSFLNEEEIKLIEDLALPSHSSIDLSRDMFIFASYAGGLRISDLLTLERTSFDGSYLDLSIYKTQGQLTLKLPNKALEILRKWEECSPRFLFPMLSPHLNLKNKAIVLDAVSSKTAQVNKNLKKIANRAGIFKRLTTHIARHTWATRALRKGITIDKVSKLMGHAQIRDTQIYAKIVNEELDKAMDVFNN